jgi:hypothetical protein
MNTQMCGNGIVPQAMAGFNHSIPFFAEFNDSAIVSLPVWRDNSAFKNLD